MKSRVRLSIAAAALFVAGPFSAAPAGAGPAFNAPAFDAPAFDAPAFNAPAFAAPAFDSPAVLDQAAPPPLGAHAPSLAPRRRKEDLAAEPAESPPYIALFERVAAGATPGASAPNAFLAREAVKLAAISAAPNAADRAAAELRLAAFYAAHHLYPECLAALAAVDWKLLDDPGRARRLEQRAHFALARDRRVLALTAVDRDPLARALRAGALARLGSYARAERLYQTVDVSSLSADPALIDALQALRIETALSVDAGPVKLRDAAFDAALGAHVRDPALRAYLMAKRNARDGGGGDRAQMRRLSRTLTGEAGRRAQIAAHRYMFERDRAQAGAALAAARRVLFARRGGPAEREALMLAGEAALALGAPDEAFAHWRRLIARHPQADIAARAQDALTAALPDLLSGAAAMAPADAARLFYDNIAFAPPGADGDRLIRAVADQLIALGLSAEAVELLRHQTFERLRGAPRARLAADLAAIELGLARPADALATIRTSRITGLDDDLNARRLALEVDALTELDRFDAALARLDGDTDLRAMRRRATIYWRAERWADAGAAYAALLEADGEVTAEEAADAQLRTAVAFALSGDEAALGRAAQGDGPIGAFAAALQGLSAPEDAAARRAFLARYREVFGAGDAS